MVKFINSKIFFLIILIIVIFTLYGKSINFELMDLDDKSSITNSIYYISDIKNLPRIFFQDTTYKNSSTYYRPILMSSFSIESIIFGYNTKIYHLTNVVMFIFTVYLIYLFFIKIKLNENISKAVCLLFALHPVLTSNVVYVSPRGEMFLTIFLLLSFICFINYIQTDKFKNLILFYIFLLLAMLSKETAAMLILILAAFIYSFNYKVSKKQVINVVVFFSAAVITYIIFRFIAIPHTPPSSFATAEIVCINAFNSLMIFTQKIFNPGQISVLLYEVQVSPSMIMTDAAVLIFLAFVYYKNIVDRKKILFCVFWYLLFLFPNFFIFEQQILFHRLLLPLIGVEIFSVLFVENFFLKYSSVKKYFIVMYVFLLLLFMFASYRQAEKYRTQETFMVNSYLDSKNRISSVQFVDYCIKNGDYKKARELLAERTKDKLTYRDILQYASLEMAEGNYDKAEEIYMHMDEDITYDAIYKNLSIIYLIKKDFKKALEYLDKFKKMSPNDVWALFQTAKIYEELGEYQKALEILERLEEFYKNDGEYKKKIDFLRNKIQNKESSND